MYKTCIKTRFEAGHRLKDYDGPCQRVHGHNFLVEVWIAGPILDDKNLLVDFAEVRKVIRGLLDHQFLNDVMGEDNVSTEFLAKRIYDMLSATLVVPLDAVIEKVRVYETESAYAEYTEED